jgi:hypothetical protein
MKMADNGASVLDIAHCDKKPLYAIFTRDKELILRDAEDNPARSLARLDNIAETDIKLYCHYPYICVSERYGLNAVVVNTESGDIKAFKREDYYAYASSFSIGFIEHGGRTLLVHQTQWNRLDITDLDTGEFLSEREIVCREIANGCNDENGEWIEARYEERNHIDYFHSLLHISPKGNGFLSNGWLWAPCDRILYFNLEKFLLGYEPTMTAFLYNGGGYNWDRPCAFIKEDIVVIATDDFKKDIEEKGEYANIYRSLLFFRLEANAP